MEHGSLSGKLCYVACQLHPRIQTKNRDSAR
nr:hypothetical protein [Aggregatibacter actinomycetemcomitans]